MLFDESASWYLPSTPDLNSNPSSDDEVSEAEMPPDEREIGTLDESPISFRLSGPNERLSRFDQSEEESASSGDSVVLSPRRKPRRRLMHKEKGKKKMPEYSTTRIGTSRTDTNPTLRTVMAGLREESTCRPRRPQHRLMSNYADLLARRTLLCGLDTMSTFCIIMPR